MNFDRHPEAFSPNNRAIIEGRNPFTDSPVNDKVFREYFSQYDVKGVRGQISSSSYWWRWTSISSAPKLHPGSGGIHNIEKEAGIWGKIKFIQSYYRNLLRSDF